MDCICQGARWRALGFLESFSCRAFTDYEESLILHCGKKREEDAKHLPDSVGKKTPAQSLAAHVLGVRGEMAFYNAALKAVWRCTSGDYGDGPPDHPPDWEVRLSGTDRHHNMIHRPGDVTEVKLKRRFAGGELASSGLVSFRRWCYGHEAMKTPLTDPTGRDLPKARFVDYADMHRFPFHKPQPL